MPVLNRRRFLGSSLGFGGLAALSMWSPSAGLERAAAMEPVSAPGGEFDSLFLTWQSDPTTTMTVQWVGASSQDDVSVSYAPLDGNVWQSAKTVTKPYPGTDLQVFRCELTGLSPGTEYRFEIGGRSLESRFRTMPSKATDEFCFVSGGDAGVGEHAVQSNVVAAAQEPHFVLIGGDLAYDNGRSPETFLTFLKNYSSTMIDPQGRLIPMVSCLGNHEVNGGYGAKRRDGASYLSVFDGFYSEKTYGVFDVGDYLSLVLLDTGHIAPVAGEQTDWLKQALAERQDRPHLIAVDHVPCYPSYRNPWGEIGRGGTGEDQRKYWCPLFERYRVDLVLEHHDHTFKRTHPLTDGRHDKNGVLYLGDGSWGKLRVPKTPEDRPYLAKVSEAYHVTVHRLQGDTRFHVALEDTGKIADVTMTVSKRAARRG